MTITTTITSTNQITIPKAVTDLLNLQPNDLIDFIIHEDNTVSIQKSDKNNLWATIAQQQAQYGSIDTPELDWGEDCGLEIIE